MWKLQSSLKVKFSQERGFDVCLMMITVSVGISSSFEKVPLQLAREGTFAESSHLIWPSNIPPYRHSSKVIMGTYDSLSKILPYPV